MADVGAILDTMHRAMRRNAIFGDLLSTEDREFLLRHSTVRAVPAGEVLCRQRQVDRRVYLLITGSVEVSEDVQGETVALATLQPGEVFGEIGALFMTPRIANVTAKRPSVVLEIPGEFLEELMARTPTLRDAIFDRYRQRSIKTALQAVPIFQGLAEEALDTLSEQATLITVRRGDIISEGEQGDALYVINSGIARVYTRRGGQELNVSMLGPGDYFGEWSLLTGAPRGASVAALNQVEAVRLGCREFLDFIKEHPEVRDSIDRVAHARREATQQARSGGLSQEHIAESLSLIQHLIDAESAKKPPA